MFLALLLFCLHPLVVTLEYPDEVWKSKMPKASVQWGPDQYFERLEDNFRKIRVLTMAKTMRMDSESGVNDSGKNNAIVFRYNTDVNPGWLLYVDGELVEERRW